MATKEQERKALDKIRKIVDELGENSYLSTAFEGCFEDAEENIEYDFGMSWKQRAELQEEKYEKLRDAHMKLNQKAEEQSKEIERLRAEVIKYADMTFNSDDVSSILSLARDRLHETLENQNECAKTIVDLADEADSPEFLSAVRQHRSLKANSEYLKGLIERIGKVASTNGYWD